MYNYVCVYDTDRCIRVAGVQGSYVVGQWVCTYIATYFEYLRTKTTPSLRPTVTSVVQKNRVLLGSGLRRQVRTLSTGTLYALLYSYLPSTEHLA